MSDISVITTTRVDEGPLRDLICNSVKRCGGKINGNVIIVPTEKTTHFLSTLNDANISFSYVSKHSPRQDNDEAIEKEYRNAGIKIANDKPQTKRERINNLKRLNRAGA